MKQYQLIYFHYYLFRPQGFGIDSSKLCSAILCSSGTTGLSKATMLSSAQCIQLIRPYPIINPTILCFSSLYWLSGLLFLLYSLGNASKRVITKRKFSPLLTCHLIEKYKINMVFSPPSQVVMLTQSPAIKLADLSSIRLYVIGGGFVGQHLRQSLQDHLLYGSVMVVYAMTETCGQISQTVPFQEASNSVGKVQPNVQIKVKLNDRNLFD